MHVDISVRFNALVGFLKQSFADINPLLPKYGKLMLGIVSVILLGCSAALLENIFFIYLLQAFLFVCSQDSSMKT